MNKFTNPKKEELLRAVAKSKGSSKRKTTDEQLHEAGEKLAKIYERKFRKTD